MKAIVERLRAALKLEPHPEGGFYAESYRAGETIPASALPRHGGIRSLSTAIYYLLTSDTFSQLHRLRSDEVFHFYLGDPVEMIQLDPDGQGRRILLGSDPLRGLAPQVVVPRGVWQGARLVAGGHFALLGCTVAPGFAFADYQAGEREMLVAAYPAWREDILALTR